MMEESEDFVIELSAPEDDDPGLQLKRTCANLFNKNQFMDVTFSCPDGQVQAHRLVLSSASSYLYNLFVSTPWPTACSHPVIILRKATVADVRSSLEFIYSSKTRTSKNQLLGLMEVGRELGFTVLLKSIETAIRSCGVEMFRRLSANSNSTKDSSRSTSASPSEQTQQQKHQRYNVNNGNRKEISIKEERMEYDEVRDISQKMTESAAKVKNNIPQNFANPSAPKPKLPRLKNSARKMVSSQASLNNDCSWMEKHVTQGSSNKSNGQNDQGSYNNSTSNSFQLQHDKGESFVYTSEDLGMMGNDEDEDDDQNESEDDEDMLIPQQSMTIPNGISVLSIPSLDRTNGNSTNSLQIEMKQEDQDDGVPASCPWCLSVFTSLTLLQRHIKTHVGNYKPFTCEYCQNTFARSAHLKRHLRTHTGEKPYMCSICNRPFARQDKLKIHLERHVQNPVKNGNNSMTITSYPPPAMSQSSGGQVPIKILIPASQGNNRSGVSSLPNPCHQEGSDNLNITPSPLSPLSVQRAGTSITVTSTNLHSSSFSEKVGSCKGSPSPPTITPISSVVLSQKKIGKSMNFNFLSN